MPNNSKYNGQERVGEQFNYWTIIKYEDNKYYGKENTAIRRYLCKCKCGNEKIIAISNLSSGRSASCGCKPYNNSKDYNIKVSKSPLYSVWAGAMQRCYDTKYVNYQDYGGRGITVYKEWHNVENFIKDITKTLGAKPTRKHSLDRMENNKGYYPGNLRWATQKQQMNNTRLSNELTAANLAKKTGYTSERIRQLTYNTSSARDKVFPLTNYIEKAYRNNSKKSIHYIYKPEAIQYLLKRKEERMQYGLLFTPFGYNKFMQDNVISLSQLAELLNTTETSLRYHINNNRIRKEHYHSLKSKGYNVDKYKIVDTAP